MREAIAPDRLRAVLAMCEIGDSIDTPPRVKGRRERRSIDAAGVAIREAV